MEWCENSVHEMFLSLTNIKQNVERVSVVWQFFKSGNGNADAEDASSMCVLTCQHNKYILLLQTQNNTLQRI